MKKSLDIAEIKKKLKKTQDKKRYKHTKNVAEVARCLAMRYGVSIEDAYLAGMLHDCAKCFSDEKKFDLCDKFCINLSQYEVKNPALIHAKLGPYIAIRDYGVEQQDILDAICYHTTGRPGMTTMEKIIFVADYIEPGRQPLPRIDAIRQAAFVDIDHAVAMITEDTLTHLKNVGRVIDTNTQETYDYYANLHTKGDN